MEDIDEKSTSQSSIKDDDATTSVLPQNRKLFLPLKMKRGRKLKMRQDLPNINDTNLKKKKEIVKKRKKNLSLSNDEDKTSDDDEECSASPCLKPAGM